MAKIKRRVRAEPHAAKRLAPRCIEHEVPMVFYPNELQWQCTAAGCTKVAYPKTEVSRGKPQVLHGTFELVLVEETGRTFLRLMEYNILFDVSDVIAVPVKVKYDTESNTIQPYDLNLKLEHATLIDKRSNQEKNIKAR